MLVTLFGPVFWMEMRARTRRLRYYLVRSLFVTALFAVVSLVFANYQSPVTGRPAVSGIRDYATLGERFFVAFSITEFLGILFFVPLYFAGAVAADRERNVLDLLFTSHLTNREIISGKLLARLLDLASLLFVGFGTLSIITMLGGIPWVRGLYVIGSTVTTVLFTAALAILVSIGARRVMAAIMITYLLMFLLWCVGPFIGVIYAQMAGGIFTTPIAAAFGVNPLFGMLTRVLTDSPAPWGDNYWYCFIGYGLGGLVLVGVDVALLRRLALWVSTRADSRPAATGREQRPRRIATVWNNPVAWREVRTIAAHRRMRWVRIMTLLLLLTVSSILWIAWLVDIVEGRSSLNVDLDPLCFVVTVTSVVAWLLVALQGGVSLAFEREHATWDAVLATPLSGLYIVVGKLLGVLRSSIFAVAFPIGFIAVGCFHRVCSPRATILSVAVILIYSVVFAALGIFCSQWSRTSTKGAGWAGGITLVLCMGIPLAVEWQLDQVRKYQSFPATFVSPSFALSYAVYEHADGRTGDAYGRNRLMLQLGSLPVEWTWGGRTAITMVHAVFALVAGTAMLSAVVWMIETNERSGLWP